MKFGREEFFKDIKKRSFYVFGQRYKINNVILDSDSCFTHITFNGIRRRISPVYYYYGMDLKINITQIRGENNEKWDPRNLDFGLLNQRFEEIFDKYYGMKTEVQIINITY